MSRKLDPFTVTVRSGAFYYRMRGWPSGTYRATGIRDDGRASTRAKALKIAESAFKSDEDVKTGSITFWTWANRFYTPDCPHMAELKAAGRTITERSRYQAWMNIQKHIKPLSLCRIQLSRITKGDVRRARDELIQRLGPCRMAQNVWGILTRILRTAADHEMIAKNPAAGLGQMTFQDKERGAFTHDEIALLFGSCPGPWESEVGYALFKLAYLTGMRRGELFALTWSQITPERILIDRAWKDEKFLELGPPKWGRVREVVMTEPLKKHLAWWLSVAQPKSRDYLVFSDVDGRPIPRSWWSKAFNFALIRAGIDKNGRTLTPHSFRHTLASDLAGAGVPSDVIRGALGWSSDVVRKGYTHIGADRQLPAMSAAMNLLSTF